MPSNEKKHPLLLRKKFTVIAAARTGPGGQDGGPRREKGAGSDDVRDVGRNTDRTAVNYRGKVVPGRHGALALEYHACSSTRSKQLRMKRMLTMPSCEKGCCRAMPRVQSLQRVVLAVNGGLAVATRRDAGGAQKGQRRSPIHPGVAFSIPDAGRSAPLGLPFLKVEATEVR